MPELLQQYLVFIALNLALFATANTIVWRYYESEIRDSFDWLILFFLFAASEVLLVLGVIGFMGQLNLQFLAAGVGLCFLLGGLHIPFMGRRFELGTLGACKKLRQLFFRGEKGEGKDWIWAVFGFLVLFGAVELFNAFIQFPWEYDTIAYHMPIVVEWIQAGSLWDIFYAVWGGPLGYYPSNHELMLTWLVLPFGNDYIVNLANFAFVGVMIVVVYKILKEMGVSDFLAWLAGALVMVMPIFLRQVGTGQVDILMALGVLIAWYYFLRVHKRKDGVLLIPLCLNLSIMLGAKYLSIIYIIPILVVFFFFYPHWRKSYKLWWLWFLAIMGTLGSMWYWRNLILTGNPVFPADVNIADLIVFQGYTGLTARISELSLWFRVTESGEWGIWLAAMVKETGWHLLLVLGAYLLLLFEMIYKLLFSKMKRGEGKIYTLMLFFLPAYWYLYFIAPYTASMMEHNVRYAMPWLMLSMIMVVYVIYKLKASRKAFIMALMAIILWQFLVLVGTERSGDQMFLEFVYVYRFPGLFFTLFVSVLGGFMSFDAWRKKSNIRFVVYAITLAIGFLFLSQAVTTRSDLRAESWQHKYAFPIMQAYEWLDENVGPDEAIANSLNPLYYPLYGEELKRKVRYININDCGDCDYYSYQAKGLTVRDNPDYDAWLANLKSFSTDYVLLGYSIKAGLEGVEPVELDWAAEHEEAFEKVFELDEVFVYKVL